MKVRYTVYSLQEEEILLKGDYSSDYENIVETRTTMRFLKDFDSESEALLWLDKNKNLSKEFTIIPVRIIN